MAAQTSRVERDALFVALDDLRAAGGSVALSRVSAAPATTLQNAMELLVAAGHADAVVTALDAAEQQANDNLMRLCQQTLDLAREKVERETVGEQLLRAAPKDIVGEIQGFAAPAAPEPRRVRLKRQYDAEVAASAALTEKLEKQKRWSAAAKPVLELLRRRRHEGTVSIEAVGAALLIAAENEPLDAWLNAVEIPRPRVDGWGREAEDEKLKDQWERDFGYDMAAGVTLLYAACCLGDVEAVKLFLRHGAWIHAGSREGGYLEGNGKGHPLGGALAPFQRGGSPECALAILDAWTAGTGVNGYPTRHGHSARLGDGSDFSRNPLHDACGLDADADALAVVKKLVSLGARVDPPNYDGERPLHIACERGHATLVAFLLREGADPATAGEQFQFNDEKGIEFELQLNACSTPLEICEARGYDDCAALVRKALGNAAPTEPTTPEDYRQDLETVRACLGRNFWRYYGLKGEGPGRHRRIASDDAFPEETPAEVDAAFKRLKDRVFDIRDYQARRREPELYAKWEAWEKSAARDAWEAAYRSESDDANPWGDY